MPNRVSRAGWPVKLTSTSEPGLDLWNKINDSTFELNCSFKQNRTSTQAKLEFRRMVIFNIHVYNQDCDTNIRLTYLTQSQAHQSGKGLHTLNRTMQTLVLGSEFDSPNDYCMRYLF